MNAIQIGNAANRAGLVVAERTRLIGPLSRQRRPSMH